MQLRGGGCLPCLSLALIHGTHPLSGCACVGSVSLLWWKFTGKSGMVSWSKLNLIYIKRILSILEIWPLENSLDPRERLPKCPHRPAWEETGQITKRGVSWTQLPENSEFESKLLPSGFFSTVHLVSVQSFMGSTTKDWDKNMNFLCGWTFLILCLIEEDTETSGSGMTCHGVYPPREETLWVLVDSQVISSKGVSLSKPQLLHPYNGVNDSLHFHDCLCLISWFPVQGWMWYNFTFIKRHYLVSWSLEKECL